MKYLFIAMVLAGCGGYYSENKTERGIVVAKQFTPELDASGTGVGFSTSGNMVVTSNHIHEEEHFRIAFQCEHGSIFTVDNKAIFPNLKPGDSVTITYRERYSGDSTFIDYDFITAQNHEHNTP